MTEGQRVTPLPPHPRVLTYVNKNLQTANLSVVGEPHPDVVIIHMTLSAPHEVAGAAEDEVDQITEICITNIYNPNRSADSMPVLKQQLEQLGTGRQHLVVGDFNAHHPLWESRVSGTSRFAHQIVETTDDLGLALLTPRDCPTYESREGRFSTIDLAFATDGLAARVLRCDSLKEREPGEGSDHLPIHISLNLAPVPRTWPTRYNLKKCDAKQLAAAVQRAWTKASASLRPIMDCAGVESWAAALQGAVVQGLEESAPRSRPCSRSQPWFDHNEGRSRMNKARRAWQAARKRAAHPEEESGQAEPWQQEEAALPYSAAEGCRLRYLEAKREYYTSVKQAKKDFQKQALADADGRDLWKLASLGKGGGNATQVSPLALPDGGFALQAPAKAQVLRNGLWPAQGTRVENDDDDAASEFSLDSDVGGRGGEAEGGEEEVGWVRFGDREVAERIGRSKKRSAPGPDGITWEALRLIMRHWDGFVPLLRRIFNECIQHGCHPGVFKRATTVILRKPGKPDYSVPGAYRPIALLNVLGKLLEALVAARILAMAETTDLLSPNHFGGRPSRATEDALVKLKQFIADNHRRKRHVLIISVDVSGAYNGVVGRALIQDLREAGWPEPVIKWAASFMKGRSTSIRLDDYTSEQMELPDGLPQGSPVSQLLWLAYSRGLADAIRSSRRSMTIAWVDDVNFAFGGADLEELVEMGQEFLDVASDWARGHGATFDAKKTGACIVHRPKTRIEGDLPLRLNGRPIARVDHLKILGLTFQEDNKFDIHTSNVVKKATRAVRAILGRGNRAWGFGYDQMRQLYEGGVLPIMAYASTVWIKPPGTGRGSGRTLTELAKVQRLAALKITGAFRSTASEVLDFEASLLPLDLRIYEPQEKSLIRLLTLPDVHPLVPVIERAKNIPVSRIPGPLHLLFAAFPEVAEAQMERKATKVPGGANLQRQAHIAASKEEAARRHEAIVQDSFETTLHVYTDGSGDNGRFGAAFYVANPHVCEGEYEGALIPLGTQSTVFRAEATALDEALRKLPGDYLAHVWTDSQALAHAINSETTVDAQIQRIRRRWAALGNRVEISWIPGHWDIMGNEEADERAKAAAARECEDGPTEAASLRLRARLRAMQRWQERWDKGTKGKEFRKANKLAVGGARKLYKGKDRATVSAMVQLRTGHLGLNRYLKWRKVTGDARCERCHEVETREHLLFSCCRTRKMRAELEKEVGIRKARSTWALLNSRDLIHKTTAFFTQRFKAYKIPS